MSVVVSPVIFFIGMSVLVYLVWTQIAAANR